LADDIEVQAVERASRAGVIVVIAAGNSGSNLNTMSSPGTAPSAITVGAVTNDRVFGGNVSIEGAGAFSGFLRNTVSSSATVTAPFVDVVTLDGDGQACSALPAGSLRAKIALILRGNCTFEVKLINAQSAGAAAAVVYAGAAAPDPFVMYVGSAT